MTGFQLHSRLQHFTITCFFSKAHEAELYVSTHISYLLYFKTNIGCLFFLNHYYYYCYYYYYYYCYYYYYYCYYYY